MIRVCLLFLLSINSYAEPFVLATIGSIEPIEKYFNFEEIETEHTEKSLGFPIITDMKVQEFDVIEISSNIDNPIFIVGDDDLSKKWISENKTNLEKMNALGLVVSAVNEASYLDVAKLCPNNEVIPADGDWVIESLGLSWYPALIKKGEAIQ